MHHVKCAIAALVCLACSGPSADAFVIDSFDDPQSASAFNGNDYDTNAAVGGMLGGDRDLIAHYHYGPHSVDADVNSGGGGLLNISLGANTAGHTEVHYDGIGAIGLGGVDFTAGGTLNAIAVHVPFDDLPVNVTITARSGLDRSSLMVGLPGAIFSPTVLPFMFSDFIVDFGAGANFTAIDKLEVAFRPQIESTDLQIDMIEVINIPGDNPSVPEPSTYAMAGMALAGLALCAWRRRRRA